MKTVQYYLVPRSPWTYLGHQRFREIAKRHGAVVEVKPFNLGGRVFPISGGLPLPQRAPQRKAYRLVELKRWSEYLGVPMMLEPKFASDELDAAKLIITADQKHGADKALDLAGVIMRGVWADGRDIADADTLERMAEECGLPGDELYAARESAAELYDRYTEEAIEAQVFGAPWYVYRGVPFWGQDRLDFLDRALAAD